MTNTTTFKWFPILGFEHLYEVREDGEQVRSKAQTLRVGDKIKHKPVILLKKDRRGCYTLRKRNGEKSGHDSTCTAVIHSAILPKRTKPVTLKL